MTISQPHTRQGRRSQTYQAIIFLIVFFCIFGYLGRTMGLDNMMNTLINTAYKLLMGTVFWLMAITVLMGALSSLLAEFGVVQLLERLLRPLMRPLFNLPGAAALGAVVTFLSDNPAIISLSKNGKFARYFKTYQLVSLTNFGTAFGMGLVVIVFMMSLNAEYVMPAFVGLFAAACGCLISTRLMQRFTLRSYPEYDAMVDTGEVKDEEVLVHETYEAKKEEKRPGVFMRVLNAMLSGGKNGVDLGLSIIPGVLIITTFVLIFTNQPPEGGFTGAADQGVGVLPWIVDRFNFIFDWLFGFTSSELIAFPLTALGSVGAALGLVKDFEVQGILNGNAVAVFTAIGMCWSGYLSTHAAMLDSMGYRQLISKAILSHTIAGLFAGIIAHWGYVLIAWIFC